jgi:tetratricopeptide (TPR) repeat protein
MSTDADSFRAFLTNISERSSSSVLLLLDSLDAAETRYLRLCAIPHEFSPLVLTLLDPALDIPAAQRVCDNLANLSIVAASGRDYVMHDSARHELFAAWLTAPGVEFHDVNARLVLYYEQLLDGAEPSASSVIERKRMFHLLGSDLDAGIAEFEYLFGKNRREYRLNVCDTLVRLAGEYLPLFDAAQRSHLTYAKAKLAYERGNFVETVELLRDAIANSESAGDELRVRMLNRLGIAHDALKEGPAALDAFARAERLAHDRGLWRQLVRVRIHEADAIRHQGDIAKSEELLREVLPTVDAVNDPLLSVAIHNSLGELQRQNNEIDGALASFDEARRLVAGVNQPVIAAQVEHNIGAVYSQIGDWDRSREYCERSLELNGGRNVLGEGRTLLSLSNAWLATGKTAVQAEKYASEAYKRFEHVGAVRDMARSQRMLARIYEKHGGKEQARGAMANAATLFRRIGDATAANDATKEISEMGRPRLPWWGWCALIATVVLTVLFVVFVITLITGR